MTGPASAPCAPTPKRDVEELKRALVPLAAIYHGTPILDLPSEVLGLIADIATAHGGDMAPAWLAWRDACRAARARGKE